MNAVLDPTATIRPVDVSRVVVLERRDRPAIRRAFEECRRRHGWPFREPVFETSRDGEIVGTPAWFKDGPQEYGRRQSHIAVLERALSDGVESVLVLDDAVWQDGFEDRLTAFLATVPEDWDQIAFSDRNADGSRPFAYAVRAEAIRKLLHVFQDGDVAIGKLIAGWQRGKRVYSPPEPILWPRGTEPREVLLLHNGASPGDVLVMEAAIASLHAAHPGKFLTAVSSFANAIYDNHPLAVKPRDTDRIRRIDMRYPAVNQSNDRGIHFMQAYCEYLCEVLGVPVPLAVNRPRLYLSAQEKGWINQVEELTGDKTPFWLVNAGRKSDFTAKWAGTAFYQAVVDAVPAVRWVQIGEQNHHHPALRGVVDLRGKTDTRQLIRLAWHARGGLGPSTFLQHVMAAHGRPYVCIAGGREPVQWLQYPMQTTFHAVGRYDCCRDRACWKSRTVPLGDGREQDGSLCSLPVVDAAGDSVPRCLFDISPAEVARAILNGTAGTTRTTATHSGRSPLNHLFSGGLR